MTKAPQSNLPPQAQPWGRYIEKELADLQLKNGIVGQDSNNTLTQLNSSIELLSQQQKYLSSFKTYYAPDPATYSTTNIGYETTLNTVTKTFTTDRVTTVLIQSSINPVDVWADDFNGSYFAPQVRIGNIVSLDSNVLYVRKFENYISAASNYVSDLYINGGTTYFSSYVLNDLSAGTHTISSLWNTYMQGDDVLCSINNTVLTISIIG